MPSTVSTDIAVDSFDAACVSIDDIVKSLGRVGGCVIRNFMSTIDADKLAKDMRPFLMADAPWEGEFFPKETRRVQGLAGKSPLYMQKLPGNSLYQGVCREILKTETTVWVGDKQETNTSEPQINSTVVLCITPGAKAQPLHRDDMLHHRQNPSITHEQWTPARESAVGLFVAGTKTTKANGATRFIPGSHLEDSLYGPPDENKTVYAELEKGDAFIMLASCYHGGSANMTTDELRTIYGMFMTRGFLRQEENQFLANPIENVRSLPLQLQKALGYSVSEPFLGWVDLKDPIAFLQDGQTV